MIGDFFNCLSNVSLWIEPTCVLDSQLLAILLGLIFYPLAPLLAMLGYLFEFLAALLCGLLLVIELECVVPLVFIEVQQHLFL
jgi:hypothetical protein